MTEAPYADVSRAAPTPEVTGNPSPLVRLAGRLDSVLSDAVMGFLALVSLFLGVAPAVFACDDFVTRTIARVELGIILVFACEYVAALVCASSKSAFVLNPWRVLDAVILALGLASVLEPLQGWLRQAPVLRLIRLGRLAFLGRWTGAALLAKAPVSSPASSLAPGELRVHAAEGDASIRFVPVEWETALTRIRSVSRDWIFACGIDAPRLGDVAAALGVPEPALRARLFDSTLPRVERMERYTALFAWYPDAHREASGDDLKISRTPVLLVGSLRNVVVLTREPTNLMERTLGELGDLDPGLPILLRLTHALLKAILRRYGRVLEQIETSLLSIDAMQAGLSDRVFLDRTFRLRHEVSRIRASIRHLRDVLRILAEKPVAIHGFETEKRPLFALLADDADELFQGADDHLESLGALVDVRLNVASFQMNKVMRLLAIFTALTLIPAITGGLLGMNLTDSPWRASLPQVAFGVGAGMLLSLYLFAIKGWFR